MSELLHSDSESRDELHFVVDSNKDYVKLNVGGELFLTSLTTLTKACDSMLGALFRGKMDILTDDHEWIRIDRSGKHFGRILNFLRDDYLPLPNNKTELEELMIEAKYYCLQELVDQCKEQLERDEDEKILSSICSVFYPNNKNEANFLVSSANRPVVKLIINRHNNKYSYTTSSDENLLKNLDLFDKLSLKFRNRILFIKDIVCNNEICCWSFYGEGTKDAEICCTSIVYATDKKHTKVEFPEARIYEELLNILLFEKVQPAEIGSRNSKASSSLSDSTLSENTERTGECSSSLFTQ